MSEPRDAAHVLLESSRSFAEHAQIFANSVHQMSERYTALEAQSSKIESVCAALKADIAVLKRTVFSRIDEQTQLLRKELSSSSEGQSANLQLVIDSVQAIKNAVVADRQAAHNRYDELNTGYNALLSKVERLQQLAGLTSTR